MFPKREANAIYDYGQPDDQEWTVDAIVGHEWKSKNIQFKVRWMLGDETWEPRDECENLLALDEYLNLHDVKRIEDLPRRGNTETTRKTRGSMVGQGRTRGKTRRK